MGVFSKILFRERALMIHSRIFASYFYSPCTWISPSHTQYKIKRKTQRDRHAYQSKTFSFSRLTRIPRAPPPRSDDSFMIALHTECFSRKRTNFPIILFPTQTKLSRSCKSNQVYLSTQQRNVPVNFLNYRRKCKIRFRKFPIISRVFHNLMTASPCDLVFNFQECKH